MFSITFKSGDGAGQLIFFRRVLATQSLVERALCTGAFSSWNKQLFPGKCLTITGQILSSRMLMYLSAFTFPSTLVSVPSQLQQMHSHTLTLNLWSVLPFTKSGLHPSPRFLHTYTRLSCPIQTCDPSLKITLLHWY